MRNLSSKYKHLTDDIKIEKNSIKCDKYDEHKFRDIVQSNPRIKQTNKEGSENYEPFHELHQDLFDALYKYEPEKVPENRVAHTHQLNSKVMDSILENEKYKELRNVTTLDEMTSTVGLEVLGDDVKHLIDQLREEFEKNLDAMEKAAAAQQKAQSTLDDEGATDKTKAKAERTLKQAQDEMEKYKQANHDLVDKNVNVKIGHAIDKAINEAKETSDMITNWGLEQSPGFARTDYQSKLALLDKLRNSPRLKKIAELAGRYKRLASNTQKEKIKRGLDEVYDITTGDELERLLPQELLKIKHPILHKSFKRDYTEKTLLQYQFSGKQKKSKGPIIVCLDSSGSMEGQAEVWSKAVAMGILEIARIQKRSLHVIHFDSSPKNKLHTNSFIKGTPPDIENVIDCMEYFANGGTDFEPPLELSQDKIDTEKEFIKADIIFVTDGESCVRDKWLKNFLNWKKLRNVSIYSILIDVYDNADSAVKLFSDKIEKLSLLRHGVADNLAIDVFTSL